MAERAPKDDAAFARELRMAAGVSLKGWADPRNLASISGYLSDAAGRLEAAAIRIAELEAQLTKANEGSATLARALAEAEEWIDAD